MTQPIKPVRTVEELMKPRYKVLTPWPPLNNFKEGDIVTPDEFTGWHPKDYPLIFRRLEWWEERSPEDMPEYVKYASTGKVYKAIKYKNGNSIVQIMDDFWKIPMWNQLGEPYWIPATEQDYTTQNP